MGASNYLSDYCSFQCACVSDHKYPSEGRFDVFVLSSALFSIAKTAIDCNIGCFYPRDVSGVEKLTLEELKMYFRYALKALKSIDVEFASNVKSCHWYAFVLFPLHFRFQLNDTFSWPRKSHGEIHIVVLKYNYDITTVTKPKHSQILCDKHGTAINFSFPVQWIGCHKYLSRMISFQFQK